MTDALLDVKELKVYFPVGNRFFNKNSLFVKAVDDISFRVQKGETLGIVGESGCGKSTMGRSILRLIEPTSGSVKFKGREVTDLSKNELRKLRSDIQIVFQDPYASLNPQLTVESILVEALSTHQIGQHAKERKEMVTDLLVNVGLSPKHAGRYPHEFSGGQRQRIGIARAIAVNPSLIVADEPVSALDVSVQAQILNLFQHLKKTYELTYIFIAHDLSVVKHVSDRIGVMYLGKMVEQAGKKQLFQKPLHPYTQALMSAIPSLDPDMKKERIILKGDVPSPISPPTGCYFNPRCQFRMEVCEKVKPREIEAEPGHFVSCHLYYRDIHPNPTEK
ncbi:dipeptide ABC transporter ATP-binding protein [Brevibacillus sp. AY1]|uniref:ABC transporter ATP-binding protein n=1 Tax=Brevibacillus sp. AY1 TaxID=2807621 RepID=UPI0024558328|nr:dipeptide ABC transporter ATP-binding protein [Brevibacillus sp. AY1]MDH4616910.1 dipeptide ABC transporter ATP-binding protein [Brevibacillus sp. AY1]